MILRDATRPASRPRRLRWLFWILIPVLLLGSLAAWKRWPSFRKALEPTQGSWLCNAETVTTEKDKKFFENGGVYFHHGETQVATFAHTGKHSSRVYKDQEYGMAYESLRITPGEKVIATIWMLPGRGSGSLIASSSWNLYIPATLTGRRDGDWVELRAEFYIPSDQKEGSFSIYTWNPSPSPCWFDDLEIRRIPPATQSSTTAPGNPAAVHMPELHLRIEERAMNQLRASREEALRRGVLTTTDDDWVDAKILDGGIQKKAHIRLKGDWTDHLLGDKWSYRVAMDEGYSWNRLVTFSLHSPHTRSHLDEWVLHKMADDLDVLTTRYDFIRLYVNGEDKGVYAWEEHFEKQLPEYHHRREGPIVKFAEEDWWQMLERQIASGGVPLERMLRTEQAAPPEPFFPKRTLSDSTLSAELQHALALMEAYRQRSEPAAHVFDVQKLARYYALLDLMKAYHTLMWHNERFYYNPVINRLEPIVFDGFTEGGALDWLKRPYLAATNNPRFYTSIYGPGFEPFFQDEAFLRSYVSTLRELTRGPWLGRFYVRHAHELHEREAWLGTEYLGYRLNVEAILQRARITWHALYPLNTASVTVHLQHTEGSTATFEALNFHLLPVIPVGLGKKPGKMEWPLTTRTVIPAFDEKYPAEYALCTGNPQADYLFYEIPGIDSLFSTPIRKWAHPAPIAGPNAGLEAPEPQSCPLYTRVDSSLIIRPGKHVLTQDLRIPKGYTLHMGPGTEIDLRSGARILSWGRLIWEGSRTQPIRIHSSDGSGQGLVVLQCPIKSLLSYVHFEGLRNFSHKGWTLTGAVTFYESDVRMDYCSFTGNHCEDGLNLVRSFFDLEHCYFAETQGDAFDADFCYGSVNHCAFYKTGNDALDMSGSSIRVNDCQASYPGDKGMSCGEEATIEVQNFRVDHAAIGIASKDLSVVTVRGLSLTQVQQGMVLYQKKPEYGPATLVADSVTTDGFGQKYVYEHGSTLVLDGDTLRGDY